MPTATIHPMPEVIEGSCLFPPGVTHLPPTDAAAIANLAALIFAGLGGNLDWTA